LQSKTDRYKDRVAVPVKEVKILDGGWNKNVLKKCPNKKRKEA